MKHTPVILSVTVFSCLVSTTASAATYSYDANTASQYASKHWNNNDTNSRNSGFTYFSEREELGGNCTNFVSQAIMAGLSNTTSRSTLWNNRSKFQADRGAGYGTNSQYGFAWFIENNGTDRGKAWAGAHELYNYAKGNKSTYKGLHFQKVTNDSSTSYMKYNDVKVGDVIFADWEGDGRMDHTMLVTNFHGSNRGYDKIRVTYQSRNTLNRGLGEINEQFNKKALFYVYRPVNYTTHGD